MIRKARGMFFSEEVRNLNDLHTKKKKKRMVISKCLMQ